MEAIAILVFLACLFGYFLPPIIAEMRGANSGGLFLLTMLVGWTVIGWFICLIMAFVVEGRTTRLHRQVLEAQLRGEQ